MNKGIDIEMNLGLPDSTTVRFDLEWLRRVYDILTDNSIEAVAEKKLKKILIGTRLKSNIHQIYITDNGDGIPEEIQEKIRGGFGTILDNSNGRRGMGLLIAELILEAYGGYLEIEYSNAKKGTCMIVGLPKK